MKLSKISIQNLIGAGLRTWLNVSVLVCLVLMIFYNGTILRLELPKPHRHAGMGNRRRPVLASRLRSLRPYTIQDSHELMPDEILTKVKTKSLCQYLPRKQQSLSARQDAGISLRGIDPDQKHFETAHSLALKKSDDVDYAIIGKRMAQSLKISSGDKLLIRWRDKNGTFDAREIEIASVFDNDVPSVDKGQIYLRLEVFAGNDGYENQATLLVVGEAFNMRKLDNWEFKDQKFLFRPTWTNSSKQKRAAQ